MKNNYKVLLAPSYELAKDIKADATVEAEYGDFCVEGTQITLAHHGIRSANPAPCNAEVTPLQNATILVSHLDLDAVGGVLAVMGKKINDDKFWEGAEFIDVNGRHRIHELDQEIQDKLNAVYAWNSTQERKPYNEIKDVTKDINKWKNILDKVLDEKHPDHEFVIQTGKEWDTNVTQRVESKLYADEENIRSFISDGMFCSDAYYSPNDKKIKNATVTYNTKFNAITIAFADGGKLCSAKEIVQELWGPEAGGHNGIAGSPRNWDKTPEEVKMEFFKAIKATEIALNKVKDKTKEIEKNR